MSTLRRWAVPIGGLAAILLIYLVNPWVLPPEGAVRQVATFAFWITFIVLLVVLFEDRRNPNAEDVEIEGPRFVRFLFHNSRAGLFWLPIRLFVGFAWLDAGWHKFTDPAWTQGGSALRGYWERAAAIPEQGRPPISFEWYRDFINTLLGANAEPWMAWVITLGELGVGLGLIVGALTGIAAFFGALMNMSFLLAGSASTNPVLFTFAIGLILAWRVAGYYGVDRYLLPMLGAPWSPGVLFRRRGEAGTASG
jgi:thiosulfate dehydrogenase [quinone] large subunit